MSPNIEPYSDDIFLFWMSEQTDIKQLIPLPNLKHDSKTRRQRNCWQKCCLKNPFSKPIFMGMPPSQPSYRSNLPPTRGEGRGRLGLTLDICWCPWTTGLPRWRRARFSTNDQHPTIVQMTSIRKFYLQKIPSPSTAPELSRGYLQDCGLVLCWPHLMARIAIFFSMDVCKNELTGTVAATLLTPIGSKFNASHRASFIGSSYLLSMCCFTPLYGSWTWLHSQ